jgi:hypothetical protein
MICDVTPKIYTLSPKNHFDRKELFGWSNQIKEWQ